MPGSDRKGSVVVRIDAMTLFGNLSVTQRFILLKWQTVIESKSFKALLRNFKPCNRIGFRLGVFVKPISIFYGAGVADYQGCARARDAETTTLVERTGKIGQPQGPVVFLLRYRLDKNPQPETNRIKFLSCITPKRSAGGIC